MFDQQQQHKTPDPSQAAGADRRPILVTGAPRSGSTWVGNVLALDRTSGYIHEPFNRRCSRGIFRTGFPHSFVYLTPETEGPYIEALRDTMAWRYSPRSELRAIGVRRWPRPRKALGRLVRDYAYFETMRLRGARVILKDPIAVFSADWIARRFDARVVAVIRHPAGFVASLRAAGWHRVHFDVFLNQPQLMRDRLAPFADEIEAAFRTRPDAIDAGTLLWRIIHHHIARLQDEHPDWVFVRHEDLARDPEAAFPDLFARLGLEFTEKVRANLDRFTSESGGGLGRLSLYGNRRKTMRSSHDRMHAFRKRLTAEEIARIKRGAAPLWQRFYDDADW